MGHALSSKPISSKILIARFVIAEYPPRAHRVSGDGTLVRFLIAHWQGVLRLSISNGMRICVPISENRTRMTLLSAFEDFLTSVRAVPGYLSKLQYLSSLRNLAGMYQHWGMERTHGHTPAAEAMARTHQRVFLQCLRTPVREIVDEAESAAGEAGALQRAKENLDSLLPNNLGGGSRRHFIALVKSVSALLRRRQATSSR
jgi:hypothetical protein